MGGIFFLLKSIAVGMWRLTFGKTKGRCVSCLVADQTINREGLCQTCEEWGR